MKQTFEWPVYEKGYPSYEAVNRKTVMKTVKLIQDGDDLVLPLDDELLKALNATIGDTLQWIDNNNGTFTIVKKENTSET